tara:strand:- start:40 stop:420 length:381 start_codon:yes stop_codon:yes gene_type:complete
LKTPIGIAWRNGFVRCCTDTFDKSYLISEMKRNPDNIMPVVVLNPITKKAECFIINSQMTDFEKYDNMLLCRRVEGIANYMILKTKIQKSKKSVKDKEIFCQLNEEKNYNHKKIDEKAFDKFVSNI